MKPTQVGGIVRAGSGPVKDDVAAVSVLGCPVTPLDLPTFADRADDFIRSRTPHHIAMINVAKLVAMRRDGQLKASLLGAGLVGADGVPVVWASRWLGTPLPGRVNGTDLMTLLLERGDERHYRIFFLGARPEILDETIARVRARYPNVVIAGARHGYLEKSDDADVVARVRESRADVIFLALPTPRKEIWAHTHLADMGVPVVLGVGGSFDVFAGAVPRAPEWMQTRGLEWLFRLAQEPRRLWRRYLFTNLAFGALVAREVVRTRLFGRAHER